MRIPPNNSFQKLKKTLDIPGKRAIIIIRKGKENPKNQKGNNMKTYFYGFYDFEAASWEEAARHIAERFGYCDADELFEMEEEEEE